jgi:AAA domain, putative AbiEii toxin, Type IV TA system/AAA domain
MSGVTDPIRLRRLTIENFRGIDRLELELPEDDEDRASALVIAGDNGCGKTSVLEAILLLLGRVDLLPADTASPRELVRVGAKDFRIKGTFTSFGDVEVDLEEIEGLNERLRTPTEPTAFGRAITSKVLGSARYRAGWDRPMPDAYAVEYFSARREPVNLGGLPLEFVGVRAVREEHRLAELKRRLRNAAMHRGREQVFSRVETFVRAFLGEDWSLDVVFEDDRVGSDALVVLRQGELPAGPEGPLATWDAIRAQAATGAPMPRVIPIDRMSSGQMALFAWCQPFIFGDRALDLALIDEPEQHLQPSWQRAFLGALRRLSPQTQFIVATHSPQVLDSVARHERRALSSSDDWRAAPFHDAAE